MKVKEPFLLIFSLLVIAVGILPFKIYRRGTGEPFKNQLVVHLCILAIGLATFLFWYSLPA